MVAITDERLRAAAPPPPPGLFVAMPVLSTFEAPTVRSLLRLRHAMPFTFEILSGSSCLEESRAEFVHLFLATECEWLLWVDSDSVFDPEVVARLIAADKDMIGAPFAKKRITFPESMRDAAARGDESWQQAGYLFAAGMPKSGQFWIDNGVMQVDWIGCGLTLVRRHVFERVIAAHPELKTSRQPEWDVGAKRPPARVRSRIFFPMLDDGEALGEDVSFCKRWTALGGKIHALVDAEVGHFGGFEYRGSLLGSFRARGMLR